MTTSRPTIDDRQLKLVGLVLAIHLGVNLVHTITHLQIPVLLGLPITGIVLSTHYVLPIIGFVLLWSGRSKTGAVIYFISMVAAFVIQAYLHFSVENPDHVAMVPVGPWQIPFQLSAVLLLGTTAAGALVGGNVLWLISVRSENEVPKSARINGVPDSGFRPLTRVAYWVSRRLFDSTIEPLTILAHHKHVLVGSTAFEMALVRATHVENSLKELAMVKAAMQIGCEFCIDFGSTEARNLGIRDEQLRALANFENSSVFSDREALVLRYTVAMTATPTNVSDELFDELHGEFNEVELVEVTAAIAFENYRGRFTHAFGIAGQGFTDGEFCPRPERPVRFQGSHTFRG